MEGPMEDAGGVDAQWRTQGNLLIEEERFAEALDLYEGGLKQAPADAAAWAGKARTLGLPRRKEEAIAAADHALALDVGEVDAWLAKGFALHFP